MSFEFVSLEEIRRKNSIEVLQEYFKGVVVKNRNMAVRMLNDSNMTFSTLFLLRPIIIATNIFMFLNLRNQFCLRVCKNALEQNPILNGMQNMINSRKGEVIKYLEWMIENIENDDGISNDFDKIIDIVIAYLFNKFDDKNILFDAVNLLFVRNRRNEFTHDLLWAIFQTQAIDALELIIKYLQSPLEQDVELAKHILKAVDRDIPENDRISDEFKNYYSWLYENKDYVYFTGECFNCGSSPNFFKTDLESKYFAKPVVDGKRINDSELSENEQSRLNDFRNLDHATRASLSATSNKMYRNNKDQWRKWHQFSLTQQVSFLKNGGMI